MNIFLEMVHAVVKPASYGIFLQDRRRKTFLFGFTLVFIYFLITIIGPFMRFETSTGGIMHVVEEYVPDFTIENRQVHVKRKVEYEDSGMYILVDTDSVFINTMDGTDRNRIFRSYDRVLLMDSQQAVFKNSTQTQTIAYEDLDPELSATKETVLASLRTLVNIIIGAGLVIVFVGMELLFFLGVVFVALFGMVAASCMQCRLTFGQLYKLGIYARTGPLILKAVLWFLPFKIPMFFVISGGISLWYLTSAIRHIKTPVLTNGPLSFSSHHTGPVGDMEGLWSDDERWNRPR